MTEKYEARKSLLKWGVYNTAMKSWLYLDNLSEKEAKQIAKKFNKQNG
jgi:hypothetical protein